MWRNEQPRPRPVHHHVTRRLGHANSSFLFSLRFVSFMLLFFFSLLLFRFQTRFVSTRPPTPLPVRRPAGRPASMGAEAVSGCTCCRRTPTHRTSATTSAHTKLTQTHTSTPYSHTSTLTARLIEIAYCIVTVADELSLASLSREYTTCLRLRRCVAGDQGARHL